MTESEVLGWGNLFLRKYGLSQAPTVRGQLHDFLHAYLGLSQSLNDELLIQEIEWTLDGNHNGVVSRQANYCISLLPPEFFGTWTARAYEN